MQHLTGHLQESQELGSFSVVAAASHPISVPAEAKGPHVLHWGQSAYFGLLPGFKVAAQGT